jgi:prepilin-type N-terminal cleavage/methylation domain-containing protein
VIVVHHHDGLRKGAARGGARDRVRAFSLPEVLITILLISILFGLGIIFSSGLRQTRKMRDWEIAISLAQQAVEVLRASPFALLDDEDAGENSAERDLNHDAGPRDLLKPTFVVNGITYQRTVEVTNVAPPDPKGTPIGLKYVKISVKWKPPDGENIPPYEIITTIADIN